MPDFSPNPSNKSRSPFEGQHHAIRLPEGPPGDMQIPGPSQMDTSQLEASGYVVVTPKHISPIPSQENSLAPSVTSEPGDRDPEEEKERQRINAGIQELDKIREAREVQQQVNAGAERIATIIKVLQTRGGPQAHTAKFWIEQNQQGKFEERFEAEEEEQKQKDKIETVRETLKTRLGTFSEGKDPSQEQISEVMAMIQGLITPSVPGPGPEGGPGPGAFVSDIMTHQEAGKILKGAEESARKMMKILSEGQNQKYRVRQVEKGMLMEEFVVEDPVQQQIDKADAIRLMLQTHPELLPPEVCMPDGAPGEDHVRIAGKIIDEWIKSTISAQPQEHLDQSQAARSDQVVAKSQAFKEGGVWQQMLEQANMSEEEQEKQKIPKREFELVLDGCITPWSELNRVGVKPEQLQIKDEEIKFRIEHVKDTGKDIHHVTVAMKMSEIHKIIAQNKAQEAARLKSESSSGQSQGQKQEAQGGTSQDDDIIQQFTQDLEREQKDSPEEVRATKAKWLVHLLQKPGKYRIEQRSDGVFVEVRTATDENEKIKDKVQAMLLAVESIEGKKFAKGESQVPITEATLLVREWLNKSEMRKDQMDPIWRKQFDLLPVVPRAQGAAGSTQKRQSPEAQRDKNPKELRMGEIDTAMGGSHEQELANQQQGTGSEATMVEGVRGAVTTLNLERESYLLHTSAGKGKNPLFRGTCKWTKHKDPRIDRVHVFLNLRDYLEKEYQKTVERLQKCKQDGTINEQQEEDTKKAAELILDRKAKSQQRADQAFSEYLRLVQANIDKGRPDDDDDISDISNLSEYTEREDSSDEKIITLNADQQLGRLELYFQAKQERHGKGRIDRRAKRRAEKLQALASLPPPPPQAKNKSIEVSVVGGGEATQCTPEEARKAAQKLQEEEDKRREEEKQRWQKWVGETEEKEKELRQDSQIMKHLTNETFRHAGEDYISSKKRQITSFEDVEDALECELEREAKMMNKINKMQKYMMGAQVSQYNTRKQLEELQMADATKKAQAWNFRLWTAADNDTISRDQMIRNHIKQRDYAIELIMIRTNEALLNGMPLYEEDVKSFENGGGNIYDHNSGYTYLNPYSDLTFHKYWYRDRLFRYIDYMDAYETGIPEEIHPDLRDPKDPDNEFGYDPEKMGKEYYPKGKGKGKAMFGRICFKRVRGEVADYVLIILRNLKKAYDMSVGTYQLEFDSPSAALFIKEAQRTGHCGYIAWVAEDKLANLATICWSEELGGSLSKAQDYFNAYMRFEAHGLEGKGANCNDQDAFAKELDWILDTNDWIDQQMDTVHYCSTEQEQEGAKFSMKGKKSGKGKGKNKGKDQAQAQERAAGGGAGGGEEGKGKGKGSNKGKTLDITNLTTFPYMFEWLKVGDKLPQGEKHGEYQSKDAWYRCYNEWKRRQLEAANHTHKVSISSMKGGKGKGKGKDKDKDKEQEQQSQQQWNQQPRQWNSSGSSSSNWNRSSNWKQDPWHHSNKTDPWAGSKWEDGYKNLSWRPKKEPNS